MSNPFLIVPGQTTAGGLTTYSAASINGTIGIVKDLSSTTGAIYNFDPTTNAWYQISSLPPTGASQIQIGNGTSASNVSVSGGFSLSTTGVATLSSTAVGAALHTYLGTNPLVVPSTSSFQLGGGNTIQVQAQNVKIPCSQITSLSTAGLNGATGIQLTPTFISAITPVKWTLLITTTFTGLTSLQLGVSAVKNSLAEIPAYLLNAGAEISSKDPGVNSVGLFTALAAGTPLSAFANGTATAGAAILRVEFDVN